MAVVRPIEDMGAAIGRLRYRDGGGNRRSSADAVLAGPERRAARRCATGCTSSPRTWSGPPRTSGTSARRRPGRSSRRPRDVGIYGTQFIGHVSSDPTRADAADRDRGVVLGRRGHRHGDLRARRWPSPRSRATARPQQIGEWVPQCFGTPDDVKLGAFCVSEPDAGSDVAGDEDARRLRRSEGRVGDQRPEDVDLERRHRQRPRRRRGRSTRRSARADRRRSSCRRGRRDCGRAPSSRRGHPRLAHRRGVSSTTCACRARACSAARRGSTPSWRARARVRAPASRPRSSTFEATRPSVGAMALGTARAAYEWALDYAKERKQFGRAIIENQAISFMLANMKTEIDAREAARLARGVDGARTASRSSPPRARCRSTRPPRYRSG